MAFVLALDQSTSASKALLFNEQGQCLAQASREHRQLYPQPGWVEHDAEEIWRNCLTVLREVAAAAPAGDIACLSLTNQRETVVVFDAVTGRPLHPALVWQCRRGAARCAELAASGHGPAVYARTGLPLDPYFSASKVGHLLAARPELRVALREGRALVGTIDAYLVHRLTGGAVFATDATNASRTLLLDLRTRAWDPELCALWDIPPDGLPEVRSSDADFGTTTLDGALPRPLPIRGVLGDSQAALFAQRDFARGAAKVTLGTGSSLLLNIGPEAVFPTPRIATTLAWQLGREPTYALEGIVISAASTLTWLRDQLGFVRDVAEFEALAAQVPDNAGVHLVPAFTGLGLPYWNPTARAALTGLTPQSDRRHVARAALESIGFQVRDALTALREAAGIPLASIRADGGPTANTLLMQFTADVTGARLHVPRMAHASPLGAAFAGMIGLGIVSSPAELSALPREEVTYVPGRPAAEVAALLKGWHRAVQQVTLVS